MDAQIQGIITLVSAALTGKAQALPVNFDMENAYDSIIKHNIAMMALEGAAICGVAKDHPTMKKLFSNAYKAIIQVERQDRAKTELFDAFVTENIDFLPLKGAIIRGLYPKREYRSMGDMDILIRLEQREKIANVMQKLGYSYEKETDHELIWRRDGVMFELHKHLIPTYNEDYYPYFGDGWKFAQNTGTSQYKMTDEDHFIFIFAHFAKHYRDGGVGIRQMCDLWVFRKAHPDMDEKRIRAGLRALELDVFYGYILETLDVWFGEGISTEKTEFITGVIYESGVFGKAMERMLATGARIAGGKQSSRLIRYKGVLERIFLRKEDMYIKFPFLKKTPALLPVMWMYRGIYILVREPKKLLKEREGFRVRSEENIRNYQKDLDYVGLRFKEK